MRLHRGWPPTYYCIVNTAHKADLRRNLTSGPTPPLISTRVAPPLHDFTFQTHNEIARQLTAWSTTHLKRRARMSTRRRASGSSSTAGGLSTFSPLVGDGDEIPERRQHDNDELDDPEYFESLDDNEWPELNRGEHRKVLDAKSGRAKWFRIYVLHLLFMWNLRTYEYASVSLIPQRLSKHIADETRLSLCQLPFRIVLLQQPYGIYLTSRHIFFVATYDHVLTS